MYLYVQHKQHGHFCCCMAKGALFFHLPPYGPRAGLDQGVQCLRRGRGPKRNPPPPLPRSLPDSFVVCHTGSTLSVLRWRSPIGSRPPFYPAPMNVPMRHVRGGCAGDVPFAFPCREGTGTTTTKWDKAEGMPALHRAMRGACEHQGGAPACRLSVGHFPQSVRRKTRGAWRVVVARRQ